MKKKIVSLLLCGAMVASLAACGSNSSSSSDSSSSGTESSSSSDSSSDSSDATAAEDEGDDDGNTVTGDASADDAFVIWGWNDDIKDILDNVFAELYPDEYSRIVFVNTGGSDLYQTKIDAMLDDPSNELYPDIMGLETDYVLKYVNGSYLMDMADIGITSDDLTNMYQYNLDKGTDTSGAVKALFWQATPGNFSLRADLCEEWLGTTDPDELQQYFNTWDDVLALAEDLNERSGGMVKLFSGYDEMVRIFQNSSDVGWYDDTDTITVSDNMIQYMELAKTFYDEDLTFNTSQWDDDWYANMDGDGVNSKAALAYCGCPWFTYWSLSADTWTGNTILVQAPEEFYWGGTGLAVTNGCSDTQMAYDIIHCLCCDTDAMVKISEFNTDFVNNKEAIQILSDNGVSCPMIYGDQDWLAFYKPLADDISGKNATAEDAGILDAWSSQVTAYATGSKDEDTALADFKAAVHDTYSYLNIGD
ncbi:MAG: hypothetical protein LUI02_01440 [Clostridiales bacterium]|nr:hypothetical protein [Clostridiales bacterium]